MNKKLPKIYVNKISKKIDNNNSVFYSYSNNLREKITIEKSEDEENINIDDIIHKMFNSPNYIYKINATIYTKDGRTLHKEVIGRIGNKLITIDDDLIPIDKIKSIKY